MNNTTASGFDNTLSSNTNLIFINSNVDNYQSLIPDGDRAEVILLDSTRHGVEQVTQALVNYQQVASIHIISHGEAGSLQLGSTILSADNLETYATDLESWSDSLTEDGDILLYGCRIGADAVGTDFVTHLGKLTDADVAASDDLTGSSNLGGDWELEITSGVIEAKTIAFNNSDSLASYNDVLPLYNGSEYQVTEFLSWSDAQAQAESLGGNLVVINDAAEQNWLRETFGTGDRFWLGLTDKDSEGNFEWVNEETSTYSNWMAREPNNFQFGGNLPQGEDYAIMNWDGSGRWNDVPDNYAGTFKGIIEIDQTNPAGLESIVDYSSFADTSQLALNGNAVQTNDRLRLTSAVRKQHGSAFLDRALTIEADTSFATQFQFQVSGNTTGADGFTFMLQNDSRGLAALGANGGSLGYGGVQQSLAIEFDSFFNAKFDLNNNHVAVLQNGDVEKSLAVAAAPFDLNNGGLLNAWIDYNGQSDVLEVYLADSLIKPATSLMSLNVDLTTVVGEQAFFGFSAATGGRFNNHDILNWSVKTDSEFVGNTEGTGDESGLQTIFDFDNFANTNRLEFNGNAAQNNNILRLTQAGRKQQGSTFFDDPIRVNESTSFSTEFQFQIGGGTNGADGFAFILQNDRQGDRALGDAGGGLGYRGIGQSIAIEFDTFKGAGDLNDNHISLLSNGVTDNALVTANAPFDLNSGKALNAWIDYDGFSDLLEVFLSDTTIKPEAAALSSTIDLSNTVGDRARVGFSAGTGGRFNSHDILNWSLASSDKLAPEGNFSAMIDWPAVAIHAGLTPDGKVLTYGLDANFGSPESQLNTKFLIWDPKLGTAESAFDILNMSHPIDNAFCSGMMLLPNGQMLIAGGSVQGKRNAGNDLVHLYDYRTGNIQMLAEDSDLVEARWYPTMTTLTDGRILLQGGRDAIQVNGVFTPEVYTVGKGSTLLNGATSQQIYSNAGKQWWYPRSWVAPNGEVFGITNDDMYYLNATGDGSIRNVGTFSGKNRGETSTAVMYDRGKILQVGGEIPSTEATIIDINGETPVLSSAGASNYHRVWADSTVLPDGTVFVSGGSIKDNVAEEVAYAAEIWNPKTNSWTVVDSAAAARLYHSTSLLLPDGTVLTAGGTTLGFDEDALSSEIYRPAYLYNDQGNLAERPTLVSDSDMMDWNQSMSATVGNGDKIERVSLVSFGAVTHSFDMGQRFLELDFTQSGNQLSVNTPESANVAPPGYYMMFAINEQGVPSEAKIVQITPEGFQMEHTTANDSQMDHSAHMNHMNQMDHSAHMAQM